VRTEYERLSCKLRHNLLPLRHAGSDQERQNAEADPAQSHRGVGAATPERGTQSSPGFQPISVASCRQKPDPCAIAGVRVGWWLRGCGADTILWPAVDRNLAGRHRRSHRSIFVFEDGPSRSTSSCSTPWRRGRRPGRCPRRRSAGGVYRRQNTQTGSITVKFDVYYSSRRHYQWRWR